MNKNKTFSSLLALIGAIVISGSLTSFLGQAGAENNPLLPQSVQLNVPYTSQAPLGEWSDSRQQYGCEEASIMMAMMWAWGTSVPPEELKRGIIGMAEYEKVFFGFHEDTSAQDTAQLMQDYFSSAGVARGVGEEPDAKVWVRAAENISTNDIKNELAQGHLVIVPVNTRLLGSALHRYGPVRHTVVVTGYDQQSGEIMIHDPFFSRAQNYRVKETALNSALWNYTSGVHKPLPARTAAMVVVSKIQP
jgi:uncharacterized protein YvpB